MFESIIIGIIVGYFVVGLLSMGLFPAFIQANDELNKEYNDNVK